ncbi:pyruvate synthase subunit PorC [Thermotoga sp.]|uniref:pyruvate synthase subunit PorC n=1 Tax=Thermotoga sp. TaxID=28240 RepID=UPI0025CF99F4|nr:pyruvate synthase subunit PorC [Thermotoga sp.]MCD6550691.1 2-oxoacid:acceptor oxidoreductase family protein [Thermotoga sp.]
MPVAKKYFEIRWHARAGQGAKSASQMLAEAALEAGKFVQAFPEYGAERRGAPMRAFNRIGDEYIRVRSAVENPDVVVVIDETLLSPTIVEGLSEDGILLVNTVKDFEFVRRKTGFNGKICVVDATDIALQEIKRGIPNTPMLGALVRVTGIVPLETIEQRIEKMFGKKFAPEIVEANKRALKRGYEEVKCSE